MRIYQLLQGVDNLSAGPTYSVGLLSHHLALREHVVTVMALGKRTTAWPHASRLETYSSAVCRLGLAPTDSIRNVRRRAKQPCIMHGHGVWRISNLFPCALSKDAQAKIVWSPRGMFSPWAWSFKAALKRPFWHLLQKPALQRVNCFHATAECELEDIRRLNFKQPVAVIPNGVEIPDLSSSENKRNRVVFLSRIHDKKGLHLLIPAWRAIQDDFPDWELHIAGKIIDGYGRRMISLADELGVKRLLFRGEVIGPEKQNLLCGSRLFVLPTFSENFGIAIAEAMAHGTPVITTTETPWTGLEKKQAGWCIKPEEMALRETLRKAMNMPAEQLDKMGKNGRIWMQESFSWQSVASKMDGLYRWTLQGGQRPDYVDT